MHGRTRAQLDEAMRVHGVARALCRPQPSQQLAPVQFDSSGVPIGDTPLAALHLI